MPTSNGNSSSCATPDHGSVVSYPPLPPPRAVPYPGDAVGSCFTPRPILATFGTQWFASVYPGEAALQTDSCSQTISPLLAGSQTSIWWLELVESSTLAESSTLSTESLQTALFLTNIVTQSVGTPLPSVDRGPRLDGTPVALSGAAESHTTHTASSTSPPAVHTTSDTTTAVLEPATSDTSSQSIAQIVSSTVEGPPNTSLSWKAPALTTNSFSTSTTNTTDITSTKGVGDYIASILGMSQPTSSQGSEVASTAGYTKSSIIAYIVSDQTIIPSGPNVVIASTTYSLGLSGTAIVVDGTTSTLPLASQGLPLSLGAVVASPTLVPAWKPSSAEPPAAESSMIVLPGTSTTTYLVGGTTAVPGGPAVVVSGTTISIPTTGAAVVLNGIASTLPTVNPGSPESFNGIVVVPTVIPAAESSTTLLPGASSTSMTAYIIGGVTAVPGGSAIVVSGTTISIPASGAAVVVNGITSSIAPAPLRSPETLGDIVVTPTVKPTAAPTIVSVSGIAYTLPKLVSYLSSGGVLIDSQTLLPGSAIAVDGKTLSLVSGSSVIVVEPSSVLETDSVASVLLSAIETLSGSGDHSFRTASTAALGGSSTTNTGTSSTSSSTSGAGRVAPCLARFGWLAVGTAVFSFLF